MYIFYFLEFWRRPFRLLCDTVLSSCLFFLSCSCVFFCRVLLHPPDVGILILRSKQSLQTNNGLFPPMSSIFLFFLDIRYPDLNRKWHKHLMYLSSHPLLQSWPGCSTVNQHSTHTYDLSAQRRASQGLFCHKHIHYPPFAQVFFTDSGSVLLHTCKCTGGTHKIHKWQQLAIFMQKMLSYSPCIFPFIFP